MSDKRVINVGIDKNGSTLAAMIISELETKNTFEVYDGDKEKLIYSLVNSNQSFYKNKIDVIISFSKSNEIILVHNQNSPEKAVILKQELSKIIKSIPIDQTDSTNSIKLVGIDSPELHTPNILSNEVTSILSLYFYFMVIFMLLSNFVTYIDNILLRTNLTPTKSSILLLPLISTIVAITFTQHVSVLLISNMFFNLHFELDHIVFGSAFGFIVVFLISQIIWHIISNTSSFKVIQNTHMPF